MHDKRNGIERYVKFTNSQSLALQMRAMMIQKMHGRTKARTNAPTGSAGLVPAATHVAC